MKKKLIILSCIFLSFLSSLGFNDNIFLNDSKNMIVVLLTIIGLCFSGFSFVSSTILSIADKSNNLKVKNSSKKLIDSIKKDILLILNSVIILIVLNLLLYLDFPFVKNPVNIDFGLFTIRSIKYFIFSFIFSLSFCFSFYAFYDLIKATFSLLSMDLKK